MKHLMIIVTLMTGATLFAQTPDINEITRKAKIQAQAKNFKKAAELYMQAAKQDDDSKQKFLFYKEAGWTWHKIKQYHKAAKCFRKAFDQEASKKDRYAILFWAAHMYRLNGDWDAAFETLGPDYIKESPVYRFLTAKLFADGYFAQKKYEESIKWAKTALSLGKGKDKTNTQAFIKRIEKKIVEVEKLKKNWAWEKYGVPFSNLVECIPEPRHKNYKLGMFKNQPAENRDKIKIVFLGDSITWGWEGSNKKCQTGGEVWNKYYTELGAANLGVSGDTTANVIWRITAGEQLAGINPKIIVLLIGVNNYWVSKSISPNISKGIETILALLKTKCPDTKILLLGVFPCWNPPSRPIRNQIKRLNQLLAKMEDRKHVWFLDFGKQLLNEKGEAVAPNFRDGIHLTEAGYQKWAEIMTPYLLDLLNNDGKGKIWSSRTSM